MGGGSSSTAKTNIATSSVVDAVARNIMNCGSNSVITQTFAITGDYNVVKDTKQVQNIKLSSDCSQDSKNIADLQQAVSNAIKQSAEAQNVSVLGALGSADSDTNTVISNDVRQHITQENIQNIVNNSNAKQEIIISGNHNIVDNFSQEQTYEIVYQNAQQVVNQMKTVQTIENAVDQESKATQTNPVSDIIDSVFGGLQGFGILWVIVAVAVIVFLGPVILKGGPLGAMFEEEEMPPFMQPQQMPISQSPTETQQLQQQYMV